MAHKHMMLGEAGAYRVASELLLRGIHVLFPATDYGIDLFTEAGSKIQVKSSSMSTDGRYHFSFRHWTRSDGIRKQKSPWLHPAVTHIVLWCIDEDILYVVPRSSISMQATISVNSPTRFRKSSSGAKPNYDWNKYCRAWNLFAESVGDAK